MGSECSDTDKEILSLEDASRLCQVSPKTLLKVLREESIPARKIGREWRFSRKALIEWIASGDSRDYSLSEPDVKAYFNSIAPTWNSLQSEYLGDDVRRKIVERVGLGSDQIAVDLGVGTGYLAEALAEKVGQVIAIDNSPEMLKAAEANLSGHTNISFMLGDAIELPLRPNEVDWVFLNMVLHHVQEPILALREISRCLKPGGRIVITDLFQHDLSSMHHEMADLWLGFEKGNVNEWLAGSGFVSISINPLDCSWMGRSEQGDTIALPIFIAIALKP